MPWLETDPVPERKKFIIEAQSGRFAHAGLDGRPTYKPKRRRGRRS
jgi:hypothetical protein